MSEKTNILFACTTDFKDSVDAFATKNKLSTSELIRIAIATYVGYDLSKDVIHDKRRKYASVDDRIEAQRTRQREKRQTEKKLMEILAHEQWVQDVAALSRNIKMDDET